jgi:tRNA A58 N-methylase Trm61
MDENQRLEIVTRIHNVIFSQVMAITHSMIELGCTKTKTREFLYRMCVIHQLGERQRQELLSHLCSM